MRFSSPRASSWAMKSRRSVYFMGAVRERGPPRTAADPGDGTKPPKPARTMGHATRCRLRRPALRRHAPRRVRHRAGELRAVVLPPHRAGGDRRRADARVRHQQRGAGHARRDVLLRLHAAADPGRRARRHARAARHPGRRARSSPASARSLSASRRRGRSPPSGARWSASASRRRSSPSSRSAPSGSRPTASPRSTASRCSPATAAP